MRKTFRGDPADKRIPDVLGLTVREVLSRLSGTPWDVKIVGSGVAVEQHPMPGQLLNRSRALTVRFSPRESERGRI